MQKRTVAIADGRTRVNAEGYHEIASLTKQLFAYIVLKLALEGAWNLDRPLSSLAPDVFVSSDERAKRITAAHVLMHAAGFENWEKSDDKTVHFEPGTAFRYSGEGYLYLQRCFIPRIAKEESAVKGEAHLRGFQRLLDKYINEPLGARIASRYAEIPAGSTVIKPCTGGPYEPLLKENTAYTAYATVADMYAFYSMMLSDGELMEKATSRRIAIADGVEWCMGFGLIDERYAFQYGDNGDSQGLFLADTAYGSVSVCLANECYGLMDAVNAIKEAAVRERLTAFLKQQYGRDYPALFRAGHGQESRA